MASCFLSQHVLRTLTAFKELALQGHVPAMQDILAIIVTKHARTTLNAFTALVHQGHVLAIQATREITVICHVRKMQTAFMELALREHVPVIPAILEIIVTKLARTTLSAFMVLAHQEYVRAIQAIWEITVINHVWKIQTAFMERAPQEHALVTQAISGITVTKHVLKTLTAFKELALQGHVPAMQDILAIIVTKHARTTLNAFTALVHQGHVLAIQATREITVICHVRKMQTAFMELALREHVPVIPAMLEIVVTKLARTTLSAFMVLAHQEHVRAIQAIREITVINHVLKTLTVFKELALQGHVPAMQDILAIIVTKCSDCEHETTVSKSRASGETACTDDTECIHGNCSSGICTCDIGYSGDHCDLYTDECASSPCQNGGVCTDAVNGYSCACAVGYDGDNCQTNTDECSSNPCQNGGVCTDDVNGYSCTCVVGFEGDNCETDTDECASNPCQNGGVCTDAVNGYSCACAAGYEGDDCQTDTDECASNPCQNGGVCTDAVNGYSCACADGFEGDNCETYTDECASSPCQNGGVCTDAVNGYSCACAAGYEGVNCQTDTDECASNPCQNGGVCTDAVNGYSCACAAGYEGDNCQTDTGECARNPCQNGGVCTDAVNGYSCACADGFEGDNCETDTDECSSNPCQNGGVCTDDVNGYSCACVVGFEGDNCETDTDECASNPCQNGGVCTDAVNGYSCACAAGYEGDNCQTDTGECASNPCQNGGVCTDAVNGYSCACADGFEGDNCETDTDECSSNRCQNGGVCTDDVNGYSCACVVGFEGDNCETDTDECASNPCQNGGECTDAVNGYSCACAAGYEGDNCQTDTGECASNPCQNGGVCTDAVNGYYCACADGFEGDNCETDKDECASNPCQNGGVCADAVNGYSCACAAGYEGDNCQTDTGECASNPCQNAGVCTDAVNGYSCACADGFEGDNCETDTDECASSPCQNGGVCTDSVNGYSCACAVGYEGVNCQTDTGECASNPCQNGGVCTDAVNGYSCACADGFEGDNCETDTDECASSPCQYGGVCTDSVNGYSCACAVGYEGVNCQTDTDECSSNPCQNGGVCTDDVNGYSCTCVVGFEGDNCETDTDECASNPCQNGGVCTDAVNGYSCACAAGYEGVNCQTDTGECASNPCQNGGVCTDAVNGYSCACADGFEGDNCETDTDECASSPCQNGGVCTDAVNGYSCTCAVGYDGVNCQTNTDECASNPCQNEGVCTDAVNGYSCACAAGYEGVNCKTDTDECASNPCQNGGVCTDAVNGYSCACADGFEGDNCETDTDGCASSPCQNGGVCTDAINGYTCACAVGYEGVNCQTDTDECSSNPCQNGGVCTDDVNGYSCLCVVGFEGDNCETDTGKCASNPCQNGGVCTDAVNGYSCACAAGYEGVNCQTDTDKCVSNPCQNGGVCTDAVNGYSCICADGYEGDNCQIATCSNYPCSGAVCSIENNQHVCNCLTGNEGTYCRTGLHLGYGAAEGDSSMYGTDDACSPVLRVSYDLPFMQRRFTKIYVCTNGLICFNRPFNGYSIPKKQGFNNDFLNIYCLAPYFADLYLTFTDQVWYQAYNTLADDSSESTDVSVKVHDLVNELYDEEFDPVYVLKATWFETRYIGGRPSETVTFQVIYATDGQRSYAFYNYAEMNFQSGLQFIGIINNGILEGLDYSSDGSYLLRPDKNLIFGAYKGAASYKLTTEETAVLPNYGVQCLAWRKAEKQNIGGYIEAANKMPLCPCVSFFLFFDRQFGFPSFEASRFTVPLLPGRAYAPHGKTCAYSRWTGGFIWFGRRAGSFHSFNEYINPNAHARFDEKYKRICCDYSNNCNVYYEVRPRTQGCYFRSLFRFGGGFGDPHISTLDGVTYTFNGYGEYILLRITSADFEIQSRTERAKKSDGSDSEATIFTAFVVQSSDAWLQAELNNEKTGINLFVGTNKTDWADYTGEFQSKGDTFTYVTDALSMSRDNNTLVTSFSGTGVAFNVTFNVGLLQMSTGLLNTYNNKTSGLLGNFNGDVTDDYFPRSASSALPSNSTERMIFNDFGQTWITSVNESNFRYDNGKSHADFNFPDFVPKFLDEANQTIVDEAKSVCGEGNNQCIFDFVFTGNKELAQTTTLTEAEAAEISAEASNEVPELSVSSGTTLQEGENYIYVTVNESATFTVNGTDDGTLTYEFVNNSTDADFGTPNDDGTVDVSFVVTSANPVYLSMTAKDDKGVNSPPVDIVIVLCTNCNSHGVCNNSVIRDDERSTDNFKYAMCECEPYWEGADCESDFDGCDASPCSVGRNCTDTLADEHKANPSLKPYSCSSCPTGYKDVDGKCEDDNECNITSVCSQVCINTVGSYSCQCNNGYRLAQDGATCNDINECEESTSGCIQVCTNTAGSYNCSCYDGFTYNATSKSCDKDQTGPTGCDALDCNSAAGCTLNETNLPVCFCDSGYQIQANNTCTDIDECTSAVCSQTCSNTVGSYSCGCFTGYSLLNDRVSCEPCPFPNYGENCDLTCQCGRGSLRCDPVRGCVCKAGWTGTHCDTDVNECLVPNTCKDVNKVCTNTIGSHTCSCRSGYSLSNNSCVDIDECNDPALNTCEQVCTNTVGGFSCSCNSGYNINTNDTTKCTDYDECSAGVSGCEHICTNKPGRYNCECYFGFLLNSDRKTCTKVSDPCTLFPDVKCSDICLVVNETPQCSCNTGFILGTDQQTCIDVNECDSDLNLCSETDTCVNEAGGYTCSCSAGYKLENDLRTCKECDPFHYGLNCASECNCGVGATRCDHVTGCVCDVGWTGEKCDTDKDECANFPCTGQNEICTNTPGSYTCTCETGYKEKDGICQDVDECSSTSLNDCSQICTNSPGSYQCSCNHGFMQNGNTCTDINECEGQNECSQVCSNTLGSYRCSCKQGFKLDTTHRKTCIPAEQCDPNPCQTNAQCTAVNDVPTCFCEAGYEFESGSNTTCEDIAECSRTPSPCSQGCIDFPGGYECACNITGYRLDTDKSTCIACSEKTYGVNCTQNCTCELSNTLYCNGANGSCTCKEGWDGDTCADDINECDDAAVHNCPVNSLCMNTNGSFYCKCDRGYLKSGDGSCQICGQRQFGVDCNNTCSCNTSNTESCNPVNGSCTCKSGWEGNDCNHNKNECNLDTFTCPHNSTCADTQGSYICNCDIGFTKTSDEECKVCDSKYYGQDCAKPCSCYAVNTKVCDHVTGNCTCNEGWEGSLCSTDINECNTSSNPCTENLRTVCRNNPGSYTCQCKEGFELDDAETCVDINECEKGTDDCLQKCNNTEGSYTCYCDAGYNGTGNACTDINECEKGTDDCLQKCNNTEGSYTCFCEAGYNGTGNDCTVCGEGQFGVGCNNTCSCNTSNTESCNPVNGSCTCKSGWEGNDCYQNKNECTLNTFTCPQNSTCEDTQGSYICNCDPGFSKSSDETCEVCGEGQFGVGCNNTCSCNTSNTESCNPVNGSCTCKSGWEGNDCSQNKNECTLNTFTCPQNSTCEDTQGSYICNCDPGFSKSSDETCQVCGEGQFGVDCNNTCSCNTSNTESCNPVNGSCTCKSGWEGNDCSQNKNECTLNTFTCPQNSTCEDTQGSYICNCDPGFSKSSDEKCQECTGNSYGEDCINTCNCEQNHTTSTTQQCENVNGTCLCLSTWTGERCEIDVDECTLGTDNCNKSNEGCHNTEGGFLCSCIIGFKRDANGTCTTESSSAPTPTTEPDGFEIVKVVLILEITLDSGVDLTVTETYNTYKTEVYNVLFNMYKSNLPEGTDLSIIIRDIRNGSLIVDYDVKVQTSALPDVAFTNAKIASSQETLQIFDENATAIGLSINDVNVTISGNNTDVLLCELYEASAGTCGTKCVVIDGKPACQLKTEIDNLPLILGLGIGIPMFFMCVALLVLCYRYHRRKQADSSESDSRSDGERDSVIFGSNIRTRINTRVPMGPFSRHEDRMEYPDYKEYSRDSRRHVYDNSRSYDNDNANYPERNKVFSWDYLFRELHPGEPYKIKRPKVDSDTQRYDEN
ncbi:uncharacterized protein LOC123561091 [Mercenaria mercenaria]|uniref:uncharacterized protein LOC123561091 n=1 Tax=Mercenaria mercenaria TaxID=6596 RepID=UPI00234F070D|nr:uncharacterized protein LOC123561091 [Mercenaria mercenaria]